TSRLFAKSGYDVAPIAKNGDGLHKLAAELKTAETNAVAFPTIDYNYKEVQTAFRAVRARWPHTDICIALLNPGVAVWKPFLQTTEDEIDIVATNTKSVFAFSREAITAFQGQRLDEHGKHGTLLFTSPTTGLRGNTTTSTSSTTRSALRSLSQSLNKQFGKKNTHVCAAVGDTSAVATDRSKSRRGEEWVANPDRSISPESIAKSYLYLVNQNRSACTWELDLRPAHEK
ncbi:NAD-P-binding protein, partial [Lactarius psammicola]